VQKLELGKKDAEPGRAATRAPEGAAPAMNASDVQAGLDTSGQDICKRQFKQLSITLKFVYRVEW